MDKLALALSLNNLDEEPEVRVKKAENITFVLVHGGSHGGWVWQRVTPLLRAAGYEVYTPTLTGLGERAHLLTPDVGLDTHVQDILGVLYYEDLHNVILVGHSYAGLVITAVAQQAAERLAHLVYLDAFVPPDGQSYEDLYPEAVAAWRQAAQAMGEGWRLPPPPAELFGITTEADLAWVSPRLTDHPLKVVEQSVRLTNEAAAALPRTYIYCNNPMLGPQLAPMAKLARESKDWTYYELDAGHDVMVLEPQKLADILVKTAKEPGNCSPDRCATGPGSILQWQRPGQ